jgi:outer membrane protein OmpA-like peptidoglycan-associated protein
MTANSRNRLIVCGFLIASVGALGSSSSSGGVPRGASSQANQRSTYQIVVVSRTARAVNYGHRSDATKINFAGTDLMPSATGEAKVWGKRGATRIQVEFEGMQKPTTFSNEYLTYVMWAISPEGRPVNLGEVLLGDNHRSKLDVTTDLQAFAMIVTAEPYYAVRRPSNLVVLENAIRSDTVGTTEAVEAKYELIDRGGYIPTGYKFDPVVLNAHLPLEFFEARNALRIAESAGAENYAAPSYNNAARLMKQADDLATRRKGDKKQLISVSREVVQTAEDAREIAVKRIDADRTEADRTSAANREAAAKAQTRNAEADAAAAKAQTRNAETDAAAAKAQTRNAEADAADAVRGRAEAERQTREAQDTAQKAAMAQAQAELTSASAQQQQQAAQAESDRNRAAAAASDQQLQQAVREREELRARLLQQFNAILETRDTARGLVVNMSDVLFDSGKYTLRPAAREKLAKISGIVLAYPSLKLAVEGNTDSVGSEAFNQELSENRAGSVRDYLVKQGIPTASVTSRGLGKTQPVASNDTAEGRQQNRRVELVVSGEVIGTTIIVVPVVSQDRPN